MDAATPREEKQMDIRVTSTDRIFYQIPTDIAALLIEAFPASFEKLEKPAPKPVAPRWGIAEIGGYSVIKVTKGATEWCYDGYPHLAATYLPDCPPEVIRAYTRLWVCRETALPAHIDSAIEAHKQAIIGS
jgi:hypothetical protein